MDLEATVRRQREVIRILTGLIAELMSHMNADDFPEEISFMDWDVGLLSVDPKLNEQQRIELRDRVEETVNRFIKEGLIDIDTDSSAGGNN
jgi:hypothetical protein